MAVKLTLWHFRCHKPGTEAQKVNKSLIDIQKKLYILKADYQGKSKFEGNQITKILNNLDELKEVLTEELLCQKCGKS